MYCETYKIDPAKFTGQPPLICFWRWNFLTKLIQDKEKREADKWLKK